MPAVFGSRAGFLAMLLLLPPTPLQLLLLLLRRRTLLRRLLRCRMEVVVAGAGAGRWSPQVATGGNASVGERQRRRRAVLVVVAVLLKSLMSERLTGTSSGAPLITWPDCSIVLGVCACWKRRRDWV